MLGSRASEIRRAEVNELLIGIMLCVLLPMLASHAGHFQSRCWALTGRIDSDLRGKPSR